MKWKTLSNEQLEEWREHPVTQALRLVLQGQLAAIRDQSLRAYWSGNPIPEADRQSIRRMEGFLEDLFETSSDEIEAAKERIDEYKRDNPDWL